MVIILGGGEEMCRTFVNEDEMVFFFFCLILVVPCPCL